MSMKADEAVQHLVAVLSGIEGRVMFATCVDEQGFVGDSDCFVSRERAIHELPVKYVLDFPRKMQVPAALLTSRIPEAISHPSDELVKFTREVLEDGAASGVDVVDHVLVTDEGVLSMKAATDLWD